MNSALKLRSLREEKNLTQIELAKILGVSSGSIGNVESGSRRISKGLAIKLSKHFDTDLNYWLEKEDSNTENNNGQYSLFSGTGSIKKVFSNIEPIKTDLESTHALVNSLIEENMITLDNLNSKSVEQLLLTVLKKDITQKLQDKLIESAKNKLRQEQINEFND